jgi:hypothetical protein
LAIALSYFLDLISGWSRFLISRELCKWWGTAKGTKPYKTPQPQAQHSTYPSSTQAATNHHPLPRLTMDNGKAAQKRLDDSSSDDLSDNSSSTSVHSAAVAGNDSSVRTYTTLSLSL